MRSLLALVVPALLSFSLIACAADDSTEPSHDSVQNPLTQEGGKCAQNSDCASNRCAIAETNTIGIRGLPAPCNGNDCGNGQPPPADDDSNTPVTKGKPTTNDTPDGGPVVIYPEPPSGQPQPAPQPAPSPGGTGICIAR